MRSEHIKEKLFLYMQFDNFEPTYFYKCLFCFKLRHVTAL